MILALVSFICFFTSYGCSPSTSPNNLSRTNSYEITNIKNVIDGDTILLNDGRKIRYIGMDTPELSINEQKKYAEEALNVNQNLLNNKKIEMQYDSVKNDIYGRTLAYVYADNIMVNIELVRRGYALVYTFPPNVKHFKEFISGQKFARNNKKGLWNNETLLPIDHTEADKYIGKLCTVKGKVIEVYEGTKVILLNFDKNYKTDFTILIYKNNLSLFYSEGIDPLKYYINKNVVTYGWIEEYNGPEIKVDNPFQIEVTD
ncbi:MAG: thermonuclease family protein [Candidatus Firestonebacteria bacterium]|nr:thermonuclease family protein [Candidatus Firestonebacteria bacterium]